MDLFSQLWLVCVTSGLAPPSLLHGAGSMDSPGTTPCTPFLLLELWGLGFTSWWGLSSHLPEMYSEISFWALLLRLPLPTSSTWIFTAGWHVHLSMVPRLRSLLLCEDGVYVSTSHLPCCLEVISERRRKKCQLYVTLVMLGVDCPSRYYCNSVAGKWFRVKGGPARCQEGLSLQAQRRPGSDENGLTDKWAPSLWQPPIRAGTEGTDAALPPEDPESPPHGGDAMTFNVFSGQRSKGVHLAVTDGATKG